MEFMIFNILCVAVALDHQMQQQLQTESMVPDMLEMNMAPQGMSMMSAPLSRGKPKSKKGKKKARKSARNDVFSERMYRMKRGKK